VPTLFAVQVPELLLALGLCGTAGAIFAIVRNADRSTDGAGRRAALLATVLAVILPVLVTVATRPAMYNGIRHFIFVLPPFAALAPGVTATKSTMYVFVGADEKDVSANLGEGSNKTWLIAPEIGFGNRQQLSNGFGMDTSIAAQFDSRGTCVGGLPAGVACGNIGTSFLGKLKLLY